ncbi:MAG: zinc-ribbon domain-containing protein [Chloroflexi bacterium]|nr:MAG: zinc-ribbon domain-containing protein [Chloroflexota bacterium]
MPCFRHFLYTNFWTMVYFHVAFSEPGREVALQHCTNCGSEIPDNAHFCGKCGHVFSSVSTIDKETSIGVENEQQSEDVATTSTQGLVHSEESKNGKQADDVAALSTQGLEQAEKVEAEQTSDTVAENGHQAEDVAELSTQGLEQAGERPEDVAELSTQGLAHSAEREQSEGKAPEVLEAEETEAEASVPSGFSEDDRVQHPVSPAPKARRGSAARWIIIAVVGLLVLAGIAGGLLFLLRSQGSVTTVTPAIGASPGANNNSGVTPVDTTCSTGACITRIAGTTPVAGTKAIFLINFSGVVQGSMSVTSFARCGPSTAGTEYDLYFSGTIDGVQYNFVARIPVYKGPASYSAGQISVVFARQPISATTVWGNSGNAPAQAIIYGDTKSGTMDITLDGSANKVHVSGYWVCA